MARRGLAPMMLAGLTLVLGSSVALAQPTNDVDVAPRAAAEAEQVAGPRASDVPAWPFTPREGSDEADRFDPQGPIDTTAGQGMQVAGIVMTVTGALGAAIGGGLLIEAEVSKSDCQIRNPDSDNCNLAQLPDRIAGATLAVPSGLLALIGVPLWIAGDLAATDAERQGTASRAPSVAVGPTYVQVTWAF